MKKNVNGGRWARRESDRLGSGNAWEVGLLEPSNDSLTSDARIVALYRSSNATSGSSFLHLFFIFPSQQSSPIYRPSACVQVLSPIPLSPIQQSARLPLLCPIQHIIVYREKITRRILSLACGRKRIAGMSVYRVHKIKRQGTQDLFIL